MILYHYTAAKFLQGIAKHGLTIGDVPTDLRRAEGRVGVWLTTSPESTGHGLSGAPVLKRQYRLQIALPEAMPVYRWSEWAPGNVTPETIANLNRCAGADGPSQWDTWFIRFGIIPRSAIVGCRDMLSCMNIADWPGVRPPDERAVAVPAWRREAWHRQLLKHHSRYLRAIVESGHTLAI